MCPVCCFPHLSGPHFLVSPQFLLCHSSLFKPPSSPFTLSANSGTPRAPTSLLPAHPCHTGRQSRVPALDGAVPMGPCQEPCPSAAGLTQSATLDVLGAPCLAQWSRTLQDKQQGCKAGFLHLVGTCEVGARVTETVCTDAPTTPRSQVSPSAHPSLIPAARPGRESHFCLGASVEMEGVLVDTQI